MLDTTVGSSPARRPRKSLGQHFLTDTRVANRIVAAADPSPADTIVEIGPGSGILTRRLVEVAGQVVAVELDPALAARLPERIGNPNNLKVLPADGRTVEITALVDDGGPYKLVANLPYYAASPIVRRFLEAALHPTLLVVMVQREVGAAMCAPPGSMTLLSVATQFYAVPSVVTQVPARSFRPPPKVASTVVKLVMRDKPPADVDDTSEFFSLVRAGFAAPRKQLRNSLVQGSGCPAEVVSPVLEAAGIDGQRRPATLTIPEWAALNTGWPQNTPRHRDLQPTAGSDGRRHHRTR